MRKPRALLLSSLEYLTLYLCRYNLPPVIPILMAFFQLTHGDAGALVSAGLASYAITLFPAGLLGDVLGPKKVLTFGATVSFLSNLAFSFAPDFLTALAIQFLNGLGQGMVWAPLTRLVSDRYPRERAGLAMSMLLLPANVGPVLAYALSGYLATSYGWRASFSGPSFALLIVTCLFWLFIKNSSIHDRSYPSEEKCDLFLLRERMRLVLVNRNIWLIAFAYACYMCISRGLLLWLPTYLMEKVRMPPYQASVLGGLSTMAGAGTTFVGAWLIDVKFKRGFRPVMALSFALPIPVLWTLPSIADENMVFLTFSSIFALLGFGGSLYFAYSPVFLRKDTVGTASGFIDSVAYVGGFLGALLIGMVYDAFLSYAPAFAIFALISGTGMTLALLIAEPPSGRGKALKAIPRPLES